MQSKVLWRFRVITAVTEGGVTNGGGNLGNLEEARTQQPMSGDLERSISYLPIVEVEEGMFSKN